MTPTQRRRRIAYLRRLTAELWDTTSIGPAPEYGYRTPADAERERRRQVAARELAALLREAG